MEFRETPCAAWDPSTLLQVVNSRVYQKYMGEGGFLESFVAYLPNWEQQRPMSSRIFGS